MIKIIATPAGDGKRVGFRHMPEDYEPVAGEVVVQELPDPELHVWDLALGGPREKTEEELAEDAREETLERLAGEAESSLAGAFINPNDVIGLLSSIVKRVIELHPELVSAQEQAALDLLDSEYQRALAKKQEVAETPPENLPAIRWE